MYIILVVCAQLTKTEAPRSLYRSPGFKDTYLKLFPCKNMMKLGIFVENLINVICSQGWIMTFWDD